MTTAIDPHTVHIVQTPVRYPPYTGGVENYVRDISERLVDEGHQVTVICAADENTTPGTNRISGVKVKRLSSPFSIANTNFTPSLPTELISVVSSADIIHTHLPVPWFADVSAIVGKVTGTPVVMTYHNDIVSEGITSQVAKIYNSTVLKLTKALTTSIIFTSEGYESKSQIDFSKDQTTVIKNAVDLERFSGRSSGGKDMSPEKKVLFLGILDEYHDYKGVDVLIDAIEILKPDLNQPTSFVIAGEGSKRDYYRKRVQQKGLSDIIQFPGYITERELPKLYSESSCFVLPSTSSDQEGFGLVLLEALASGTPVVTTSAVGISDELKRSEVGTVVPPNRPKNLASAINNLLNNPVNSKQCVTFSKEYSLSKSVSKLENLYIRAINSSE